MLDLTPATLASVRQAQGGLTDEDARKGLSELRRQHDIDICSDLETFKSGLVAVEALVMGHLPGEDLHAMLDFLLDLGYWPTWREWVAVQLVGPLLLAGEDKESVIDAYLDDFPEYWDSIDTKATVAQTNETIWYTVRVLCGLAPTRTQE